LTPKLLFTNIEEIEQKINQRKVNLAKKEEIYATLVPLVPILAAQNISVKQSR